MSGISTHSTREVMALRSLHELMTTVNRVDQLGELLQTLVQGVVDVLGFQIAVIYQLDDEDVLEIVAAAGDEEARAAVMGRRIALAEIAGDFDIAVRWGALRFVPNERLPADATFTWVPELEPSDDPDAWHPRDILYGLLHDPSGRLLGLLGVDLPVDGMRPSLMRRQVLEMYAVQAGLAIHHAQERARLTEQVALGAAVRDVVGAIVDRLDVGSFPGQVGPAVVSAFRCDRVWVLTAPGPDGSPPPGDCFPPGAATAPGVWGADLERVARECLAQGRSRVLSRPGDAHVLVTPLGTGPELLGCLQLVREAGAPPWTANESQAAYGLGQEIGRLMAHARLYETERRLNAELHELDRYKNELMDTITHELKAPLTVIDGHVELLEDSSAPGVGVLESTGAIRRGTGRLHRLVDDLLLLTRVKDPRRAPQRTPVDLAEVVAEVEDLFSVEVRRRRLELHCQEVPAGVLAWGDRDELARAVANIVGNAVKYTPDGGRVTLRLHRDTGRAVFSCTDTGIGIDPEDQHALFQEFNRTSNPEAHAIPGTGLGLAIVKRIVERHDGAVTVESRRGRGSTFRMVVPTPPAEVGAV